MIRRSLAAAVTLCLLVTGGVALAAFPTASPVKTGQIPINGYPQAVAVDLTDDTAYVVSVGPSSLVAASSDLDDTRSVSTGPSPAGVAVNSNDDTIYVTDYNLPGYLMVYTAGLTLSRQIPVFRYPKGVTVHPIDDTVYVTFPVDDSLTMYRGANLDDSRTIHVGDDPERVAVNPSDDTIYTANTNGRSVSIISPSGAAVSTVSLAGIGSGISPTAIAVHPTDDTVYVGEFVQNGLLVASADFSTYSVVPLNGPAAAIRDMSISPDGSTLYLATNNVNLTSAIALNTRNLDDSYLFTVADSPWAVAATSWGAFFAVNSALRALAVVSAPPALTSVTPSSGFTDGGTPITITGNGFIAGQTTATIGGLPLLNLSVLNSTTLTGVTPAAAPGNATINVTVHGASNTVPGGFTFVSPPPPPPVPSSAPLDVTAAAGDGSARVRWVTPTSSGSYPVSTYQVTSAPGGHACLVAAPAVTCEVLGLANGTAYTFTVKALTGAGWSAASEPSNAVTPSSSAGPSIVITGARDGRRIEVTGSTTGFEMGAILNPWIKLGGQSTYSQGSADVLVSMDGSFAWGRSTAKRAAVYMETPDGAVRSNTVTFPARP